MTTARAPRPDASLSGAISAPASIYYKQRALFCPYRDQRDGGTPDGATASRCP